MSQLFPVQDNMGYNKLIYQKERGYVYTARRRNSSNLKDIDTCASTQ